MALASAYSLYMAVQIHYLEERKNTSLLFAFLSLES